MNSSKQFYYSNLYKLLEDRISKAQQEVLLVAPFIKKSLLEKLLENITSSIEITIITRWRIEEILAGVSDIEIYDILQAFNNSSLKLCNDLHAKYYRFDQTCIFGSANLTQKALIETSNSNLEILSQTSHHGETERFEEALIHKTVDVYSDYYRYVKNLVEELREDYQETNILSQKLAAEPNINYLEDNHEIDYWIPKSRNPENLYECYKGNEKQLTEYQLKHAKYDLSRFSLPSGLTQEQFKKMVGFYLIQMPIVKELDNFLYKPRRFGEVSDFLEENMDLKENSIEPKRLWQTLMRWLLYFLSDIYGYKQPRYSEIFIKKSE